MRRFLALSLTLSIALAPLGRAAEFEAPRPDAPLAAPAPLAGPRWVPVFDQLELRGSAAERGTLAAALNASGVSPDELAASGPRARALIDRAALALVAKTVPSAPASLSDGRLAVAHADVEALTLSLRPFVTPKLAAAMEEASRPLAEVVRRRRLVDNQGRLTRTARALGQGVLEQDAVFVRARPAAAPLRLVRAAPQALAPRTPSGPPPIREHPKASPGARAVRLAAFTFAIAGLFRAGAPSVFADMDETVAPSQAPASPKMVRAIAAILKAGGRYGVLTGSSIESARKNLLDALAHELGGDQDALARLAVAARSGAQVYRYDPATRSFKLKRVGSLEGFLISRGVLEGTQKIRAVLDEAKAKFDLEGAMRAATGKGLQGDVIVEDRVEDRYSATLTQFVFVPTGKDVSKDDKKKYDAQGGRAQRELYAAYINRRLRDLGVPVEARVAGKTSIDVGVDKSLGVQALSEELGVSPRYVVWAGDSHGRYGNDAPAAKMMGLVLNVGPREASLGPRAFQEDDGGPAATLSYYRVIGLYARIIARLRAVFGAR